MTLTKSQKIKELEAQLEKKDRKIANLEDQVSGYQMKFEAIEESLKATPKDCKWGEYCRGCSFADSYFYRDRFGDLRQIYFCGKQNSCQNFMQKEVNEQ